MQLLKLVESEIQMDVALPWNVRNNDCALLLARGHIVSSEAQMQALPSVASTWIWRKSGQWKPLMPPSQGR